MIWLCVFPTLTLINLTFGDWLGTMSPVIRTFVLATIAVPIVIYGLIGNIFARRVATTGNARSLPNRLSGPTRQHDRVRKRSSSFLAQTRASG